MRLLRALGRVGAAVATRIVTAFTHPIVFLSNAANLVAVVAFLVPLGAVSWRHLAAQGALAPRPPAPPPIHTLAVLSPEDGATVDGRVAITARVPSTAGLFYYVVVDADGAATGSVQQGGPLMPDANSTIRGLATLGDNVVGADETFTIHVQGFARPLPASAVVSTNRPVAQASVTVHRKPIEE